MLSPSTLYQYNHVCVLRRRHRDDRCVPVPAPSQPAASTIPRIIHQSWKTADVPERFHEWVVSSCLLFCSFDV